MVEVWESGQGSRDFHVICRKMRAEIMGLNVNVYMGYNVKEIKERGASKLATEPSVEEAAVSSSPLRATRGVVRSGHVDC